MARNFFQRIANYLFPTYEISPESFREQFNGVDEASLKDISIRNPTQHYDDPGLRIKYRGNRIVKIYAVDDNTHRVTLDNSPALEVRITRTNGKRTIFYFDTLYIEQGMLHGNRSRFLNIYGKIPVDEIKRVEIQNGRKRFKYDK